MEEKECCGKNDGGEKSERAFSKHRVQNLGKGP